jgi:Holliday junction resolvasome RuvABC endonuclease subunit
MIVAGLDLSLTSAGVGILHNGQPIHCSHHGFPGHNGASYQARSRRVRKQAHDVTQAAQTHGRPDLIVIEGHPSGVKISAHEFDRSGLWHGVFGVFDHAGIPIAVIHPMTLKTWTTGTARADKDAMIATVEGWYGITVACDDEADGLALATAGAFHLGDPMPFEIRPRHTSGLEAVSWPEEIA